MRESIWLHINHILQVFEHCTAQNKWVSLRLKWASWTVSLSLATKHMTVGIRSEMRRWNVDDTSTESGPLHWLVSYSDWRRRCLVAWMAFLKYFVAAISWKTFRWMFVFVLYTIFHVLNWKHYNTQHYAAFTWTMGSCMPSRFRRLDAPLFEAILCSWLAIWNTLILPLDTYSSNLKASFQVIWG